MPVDISNIGMLVQEQDIWRGSKTINLIASENVMSYAARSVLNNDFAHRYAEGHPGARYYQGTKFIDLLETFAEEEMRNLLSVEHVDVRPYSGNNANIAVFLTFLKGGDSVIVNSTDAGGHISHNKIGGLGRRIQLSGVKLKDIPLYFWPLSENGYTLDLEKSAELIDEVRPKLVVLGRSLFLFPEPVTEISEICSGYDPKIPILYDGAHVFGLIAGREFQDPLREGATLMTASTHKTFPGPQRGIIASNKSHDGKNWRMVDRGVFPGSSSNHHLYTIPPLIVTIREMAKYGKEYAQQIIKNAKALAHALEEVGLNVEAIELGYTESHQVAVDVSDYGGGKSLAELLEKNNIIVNYNLLHGDKDPENPRGLRIGVQEMTRFGMKEEDMKTLSQLIYDALKGVNVKDEVIKFRQQFLEMQYC